MKKPKEMLYVMTNLYEGKNINMKMTLRTQLKDVKMQMSERELQNVAEQTSVALNAIEDEYIATERKAREDSSSDEEYVL